MKGTMLALHLINCASITGATLSDTWPSQAAAAAAGATVVVAGPTAPGWPAGKGSTAPTAPEAAAKMQAAAAAAVIAAAAAAAAGASAAAKGAPAPCREVTPPPHLAAAAAAAAGQTSWQPCSEEASPDASSTPLCWAVAQGVADAPDAGAAHAWQLAGGKRVRAACSGGAPSPTAVLPAKQRALLGAALQPCRRADGTPCDTVERSDGSASSSSCSSSQLLICATGSSGCVSSGCRFDSVNGRLVAMLPPPPQQQQQQQCVQYRGADKAMSLAHMVAAAAATQDGRRRLAAVRGGPAPPLVAPADVALAWAASALGVSGREVFLFAQHVWGRVRGRVDELLVVSLGASQPPARVAALVSLWLASKLEGNRRAVAGASRLCAATGLTRWGVTSVEVHVLQLLDFSPYRGW